MDHRTLVAAARREKTRAKIMRAALVVFAQHGVEAKVIDLIIRHAGVSRGTFYNYFRTNEELFIEVAKEVSNEIIRTVDPIVQQQRDPAARIACGIILVLKLARSFPVFAQFVSRGGPPALSAGNLATEMVPRDIQEGIVSGLFTVSDKRLAFDLILGPVIMAFHTVVNANVSEDYSRRLAQAVLQSLGVASRLAQRYASQDFGSCELSDGSMFYSYPGIKVRKQRPRKRF
jgi:AcrR family transcriptional regulator